MKARLPGDFVRVEWDACLCGHDTIDHPDHECQRCGCDGFEDADPDNDFIPGLDDAYDDEEAR